MDEVFFVRQHFPDVIDFTCIGFMTDKRSLIKLILKDTLNSGIHPQETVRDFGSSIWGSLFESLVLIVERRFDSLGIQYIKKTPQHRFYIA